MNLAGILAFAKDSKAFASISITALASALLESVSSLNGGELYRAAGWTWTAESGYSAQ